MKALEMERVSVIRDGKKILDSIDLSVESRESIAIVGSNGSGKTTLIKLLRGEIHPFYDERSPALMKIFGESEWNIFDVRNKMGIVSIDLQNQFGDDTLVSEVIVSGFFGSLDVFRSMKVTPEMISKAHDASVMMGVDDLLERTVGGLSLGEMRRTLIARALVTDPSTLVMDEPMTGLDIVMASKFRVMLDILMDAGVSLVIVTHDLEDIPEKIERVIMMKDGKIYADGGKSSLFTSKIMSDLYDEDIKVEYDKGTYHMHL